MKRFLKRLMVFLLILAAIPALIFCQLLALEYVWPKAAERNAGTYLAEHFPGNDFAIERSYYDFKSGGIAVYLQSVSSVDTHFVLFYDSFGRSLKYDTYESVQDGSTTLRRISNQYESAVRNAMSDASFAEYTFGTIDVRSETAPYGIPEDMLIPDKTYAMSEIDPYGVVFVSCAVAEEVFDGSPYQAAAEALLAADARMQEAGIGYAAMELYIYAETDETGPHHSLALRGVTQADILAENAPERLEAIHAVQSTIEKEPPIE